MEIKGAVAKRFNRQNLFQVACFDLRERFHYVVLLSFVCLRNLSEVDWDFGAVLCSVFASMYRLLYTKFSLLSFLFSLYSYFVVVLMRTNREVTARGHSLSSVLRDLGPTPGGHMVRAGALFRIFLIPSGHRLAFRIVSLQLDDRLIGNCTLFSMLAANARVHVPSHTSFASDGYIPVQSGHVD